MFEHIKKPKNKKSGSDKSSQSNTDNIDQKKDVKVTQDRKLTFQEEQYLRMQKIMDEKEEAAFEEFKKGPDTTRYDVQEKSKTSFIYGLASTGQLIALLLNACWRNPFIKYFSFAAGGFFLAAFIIYLWSLIRY